MAEAKPHSSTVMRSLPHHSSSSQETHTHTETTILKVAVLVGFMEQLGTLKNLSTSPPPLSSRAVTLSYDRRKTTRPVISPVYPSISLHPLLEGNAE